MSLEPRHSIYTTIGLTEAPPHAVKVANLDEAVFTMVRQVVSHGLNDLAADPAFNPDAPSIPATPGASTTPPSVTAAPAPTTTTLAPPPSPGSTTSTPPSTSAEPVSATKP
jgi:hypothetical protein